MSFAWFFKFAGVTHFTVIVGIETGADIVIGAVELEVARAPAVWLIRDGVALHLPGCKVKLNEMVVALNDAFQS